MSSKYKTIQEASQAVVKLGILNSREYNVRYKEDPKLPARPVTFYGKEAYESYGGWHGYSGQNPNLYSYSELKKIVRSKKIKTISDYISHTKKANSGLPRLPFVACHEEWKGWFDFLGIEKKPLYETLEEAVDAAKKLGITAIGWYSSKRHLDPKLPSSLAMYYHDEWINWDTHFNVESPYETWKEAQKAVKELKLENYASFKQNYKRDKKLSWNPNVIYKDVWDDNGGWDGFFGKIMGSITASNFVKSRGVSDLDSYKDLQRNSDFLPEDPVQHYGLVDFSEFLNLKVYGLSEVKEYCKRNGIEKLSHYTQACANQEHLPQTKFIKGYVNKNSIINISTCKFRNVPESYKAWSDLAKVYSNLGRNISRKETLTRNFIQDYLVKNNEPELPAKFFLESHNPAEITTFIESSSKHDSDASAIRIYEEFTNYVFKETCQDEDPDTGELSTLPGFTSKWRAINTVDADDISIVQTPSQSTKPPLPMNYVDDAANFLIPETASSFADIEHIEADWYEVDESIIDRTDPDCVWRKVKVKERSFYQMWSPVRTCGLIVMLRMPFRGQQVCWLDSGEADATVPMLNPNGEVEWVQNDSALVKSHNKHKNPQGFVKRFRNQIERYTDEEGKEATRYIDIVGSNITTNKTSLTIGGYDIAYMHPSIIKWMIKLRDWQSKYNPITELTAWSDVPMENKRAKSVLKAMKAQAFLFRDPSSLEAKKRSLPISKKKLVLPFAWLLYQIQDSNVPLAELSDETLKNRLSEYKSDFSPHALRVSMITAYILDGELPVSIVAKLVGHASLVMTIYYTKTDNHDLYQSLSIADHKVMAQAPARVADMLKNKKISLSSSEFIGHDGKAVPNHYQNLPYASLAFKDFGICPFAGAKCDEGGELIEGSKNKYGPVRAGYLGPSNCFACRFFITGPAFIGGLQTIFDEVSLEARLSGERVEKYRIKQEELEDLKYEAIESNTFFEHEVELNKVRACYLQEVENFDALTSDATLIGIFALRCKELNKNSSAAGGTYQLITSEQNDFLKIEFEESSEFRQLFEICKKAEIYTCANPTLALPKRSLLIDKFASINGLQPSMCLLTEEEQLRVGNQITNIVLARLNGNWDNVDKLISGELFLEELGISCEEIMRPLENKRKYLMDKASRIEVNNV